MLIRNLTVKIEYRMQAGDSLPRWKALRARVVMTDAAGHTTYGSDLCGASYTNIDMLIGRCLLVLKHCEIVTFTFAENMALPDRQYKAGRLLRSKMVS